MHQHSPNLIRILTLSLVGLFLAAANGLAQSNRVALATHRNVDNASSDQFDCRVGAFGEVQFSECSLEGVRQKVDLLKRASGAS